MDNLPLDEDNPEIRNKELLKGYLTNLQELRIMYRYAQVSDDFLHLEGEYPKLYLNPDIYLRIKEIILGPKVTDIPTKIPYLQEEPECA